MEYKVLALGDVASETGLHLLEKKLRAFMHANITEANINEFGRFDDLKATVDKAKAKAYFEAIEGTKLIPPKVPVKYDKLLREFIVSGGFDLKMPKES